MQHVKRFKDPIYGYIDILSNFVTPILDTCIFQRLRRIIQTSYSPLYSSAVHNRFVHSMGVYHLGEIALNQIKKEVKLKFKTELSLIQEIGDIFLLACLLHDVGHAPFSHTGETFYLDENSRYDSLHEELIKSVANDGFSADIPKENSMSAAAHEIMSAIIGIREFGEFFKNGEEREFFSRCITGYKYSDTSIPENSLKNCLVSLLNSKVIDVDRLDYLIRDAFNTGFDTVNIDYQRLLTSLTIIINDENKFELAYYKSAVSVIENVVYAHDAERKWIQNHPIITYETYILERIISYLNNQLNYNEKKLFSLKTLSKDGEIFENELRIRLLCDDDIIFLLKNVYTNELCEEFFERRNRRHPVWKSEAEYKTFFGDGNIVKELLKSMELTANLLKSRDSCVIDNSFIEKVEKDVLELKTNTKLDELTKHTQVKDKQRILKFAQCLKKYADRKEIDCNFVIISASHFKSGFGKPDFSQINIVFKLNDDEKIAKFGDIASSLSAKETLSDDFFYLFYKRKDSAIDKKEICKSLLTEFYMQ